MAARPPLVLYILRNPTSLAAARIVAPSTPLPAAWSAFVEGDSLPIQFGITDGQGNFEDLTGRTYRVGLGSLNQPPTAGTFTLSDGVATTANLPYNIAAGDLQTALNALNGNTGPFGQPVQVTGGNGAPYTVAWQTNGSHALLAVNAQDCSPVCVASATEVQAGDASTPEIQQVRIVVEPFAYSASWTIATATTYAIGTLAISSAQLAQALQQNPNFATYFEIGENDGGGDETTILQAPVTVNGTGLPPPANSPTGAYGFQVFAVDITNGNSTQAITFPQAFTSAPTKILLTVIAPDGTHEVLWPMAASVTNVGFTLLMNGAPSESGYTLTVYAAL